MDDIEAIKQLTARYNRAFDTKDYAGFLDTWTEDGFFERSNAGRSFRGTEQLREMLAGFDVRGRHVTSDYIVEVDGDSAHQACYLTYLDVADNFSVALFGDYSDELVRTPAGWRFRARRLAVDLP
jgi:ketosteroid isomerase-like protein